MEQTLFNNPLFAQGLGGLVEAMIGDPSQEAQNQLAASQARNNFQTADYRHAIGETGMSGDLAGMMIRSLQAGPDYAAAAPGAANAAMQYSGWGMGDGPLGARAAESVANRWNVDQQTAGSIASSMVDPFSSNIRPPVAGGAGGQGGMNGSLSSVMSGLLGVESGSPNSVDWQTDRGAEIPAGHSLAGEQAIGPLQIMPSTMRTWAREHLGVDVDPESIAAAVMAGDPQAQQMYMQMAESEISSMLSGGYSPEEVAIAWHGGDGAVDRYRRGAPPPRDSVHGLPTYGEGDTYTGRFEGYSPGAPRPDMQSWEPQGQNAPVPNYEIQSQFDRTNMDPGAVSAFARFEQMAGRPFQIVSAYRDPATAGPRSARNSQHYQGKAFDIDVSNLTPAERSQLIVQARQAGFSGIGVGNNILQIDTGPLRDWGYDSNGYPVSDAPQWAGAALQTPVGQAGASGAVGGMSGAMAQGMPGFYMDQASVDPRAYTSLLLGGANPYGSPQMQAMSQAMLESMAPTIPGVQTFDPVGPGGSTPLQAAQVADLRSQTRARDAETAAPDELTPYQEAQVANLESQIDARTREQARLDAEAGGTQSEAARRLGALSSQNHAGVMKMVMDYMEQNPLQLDPSAPAAIMGAALDYYSAGHFSTLDQAAAHIIQGIGKGEQVANPIGRGRDRWAPTLPPPPSTSDDPLGLR